ncbi:MAG: ATP-dependent zinc metalloprotease FtsH [Candidatus Moranbacteria bacterium]|nr:ATP-dependent zinc metalloprotease FtsH [Candidatus Moranbacteria bacterium]
MNKNLAKHLSIALVIFIVVYLLFSLYNTPFEKPKEIPLSELAQKINAQEIKSIEISGNKLEIKDKQDQELVAQKEVETSLSQSLNNFGVNQEQLRKIDINNKDNSGVNFFLGTIIPFFFPFILIGLFFWFIMRQAQRGNTQALSFGNSRAKMQDPKNKSRKVSFKDVAGLKEAKNELEEVVEFLKTPKKFQNMGAKIPRGLLLLGPPGCGKTLLAKAVAGEANVPFFHISGSEFVEMFVGVGASRVRDLFKQAKKTAPAIVFVDEIDAVGRQRGAGLGGGHDEREQTLNQILVEMDGFDTKDNVIVIAATNRPDVLDPALLRPGRFDRHVTIDNPDIKDRAAILKIHARRKPVKKDVNLRTIAERTPGFSGADLMNLMNEAAILTARRNKKQIGMSELIESIEKVMLGPERKSRLMTKKEKKITAFHEAGHALVAHLLPNADPVHKVSIVSRGQAAGYTLKLPIEDRHFQTRNQFLDELTVLISGYTAEKIIFNDVTTGASNDLEKASKIARNLVTRYGMSDLGLVVWGEKEDMVFLGKEIHESRNYSEKMAAKIDQSVNKFINQAQKKAEEIIESNLKKLKKVAQELLEKETIEKQAFEKLLGKKPDSATST